MDMFFVIPPLCSSITLCRPKSTSLAMVPEPQGDNMMFLQAGGARLVWGRAGRLRV